MKEIMTKMLLIGIAVACLSALVFPAVWSDGGKVKDRVVQHYDSMFR